MNAKKINEYCSKIEEKYGLKPRRKSRCPVCGTEGRATPGNNLVWLHRVDTDNGRPEYHRWSYLSGRVVETPDRDTII